MQGKPSEERLERDIFLETSHVSGNLHEKYIFHKLHIVTYRCPNRGKHCTDTKI